MAGIYLFHKEEILMMKRIKKDYGGEGQYYSIGGKFEKDELNKPTECILRELEEETGLKEKDIKDLKLKYIVFRNHDGLITQNHLFFAELKEQKELKKCPEGFLEWIQSKEIFELPLPASSFACLKHYFKEGKENEGVYIAAATNKDGYGEYHFTKLSPFDRLH